MKKLVLCLLLFSLLIDLYGQNNTEHWPAYTPKHSLSLRTNVLSWVVLTPSIGVEYKTSDHVGLIIDGAWSHWNMNTQNKYWRIWNVSPQARYYLGQDKYNYIGLQYTMGEYNLLGRQGVYLGGSLTLGHQFYTGKNLMVDLGLSLGYLYLSKKENYKHIGGINYRDSPRTSKGYWGPTGLSMTFVWKIN